MYILSIIGEKEYVLFVFWFVRALILFILI